MHGVVFKGHCSVDIHICHVCGKLIYLFESYPYFRML
jgi:hypothetical protein